MLFRSEKADYAAELRVGEKVGPGMALAAEFGEEAEIVATVIGPYDDASRRRDSLLYRADGGLTRRITGTT